MKRSSVVGLVLLQVFTLQSALGIPFREFFGYPFGEEHGDTAFPKGDDALPINSVAGVAVPTSMVFPYFCKSFVYLNVSCSAPHSTNKAVCLILCAPKGLAVRV